MTKEKSSEISVAVWRNFEYLSQNGRHFRSRPRRHFSSVRHCKYYNPHFIVRALTLVALVACPLPFMFRTPINYRFFFWILLCSYIPLSLPSLYFFIPFSCLPSHPPSLIFCFPPLSASLSFFTSNPPTHRLRFHKSPFPAHSPSALHTFSSLFPLCRRHSEQFPSLLSVCLSLSLSFLFCLLPFNSASLHSPALSSIRQHPPSSRPQLLLCLLRRRIHPVLLHPPMTSSSSHLLILPYYRSPTKAETRCHGDRAPLGILISGPSIRRHPSDNGRD